MPGMMKKYQEGGAVRSRRKAPSYEEDMTPPPGMRNVPSNARRSNIPPSRTQAPTYEEDMTPPPGMRRFRSNAVPSNEPMPGSRFQEGGLVNRGESKASREASANVVRGVIAGGGTPRSRAARMLADPEIENVSRQSRRLMADNEERERGGGERKYKKGGVVKKKAGGMIKGKK